MQSIFTETLSSVRLQPVSVAGVDTSLSDKLTCSCQCDLDTIHQWSHCPHITIHINCPHQHEIGLQKLEKDDDTDRVTVDNQFSAWKLVIILHVFNPNNNHFLVFNDLILLWSSAHENPGQFTAGAIKCWSPLWACGVHVTRCHVVQYWLCWCQYCQLCGHITPVQHLTRARDN